MFWTGVAFLQRNTDCEAELQMLQGSYQFERSRQNLSASQRLEIEEDALARKFVVAMMMHETNTF